MAATVQALLVGAGQRGRHVYGAWARRHPERLRFVAVADPDQKRRDLLGDEHGLPAGRRFADSDEAIASGIGDVVVVATPDRMHHGPTIAALATGRPVLLEKPMAANLDDCRSLVRATGDHPERLHVAHVLRFTPFFQTLHEVIGSGRLGDIVTVAHRENVVAWHMAHSFVRGNWADSGSSTPMIVQKCSHDFDILQWNLTTPVQRISSFGSLRHFHPDDAPEGATARCTDGCPVSDCPFDARTIYLDRARTGWPVHVITDDMDTESRLEALRTGPYGRCVYTAGSNVVDHQVVSMETADGATVVLHMHGHSHEEARTMRYDGTRATLRGVFGRDKQISVSDHRTGDTETIPMPDSGGGHGGGDTGVIEAFLRSVERGEPGPTSAAESFESHLLAFLAERARLDGGVVDVDAQREGT